MQFGSSFLLAIVFCFFLPSIVFFFYKLLGFWASRVVFQRPLEDFLPGHTVDGFHSFGLLEEGLSSWPQGEQKVTPTQRNPTKIEKQMIPKRPQYQ